MTHMEIEEIARSAEGNIVEAEHEQFIKHIAQCEDCRKFYSTTSQFVEDEVIIGKELSSAEEIEKLLEKFGQPQRVMRHSSGNFHIYRDQRFSIKEINGKVLGLTNKHNIRRQNTGALLSCMASKTMKRMILIKKKFKNIFKK